MVCGFVENNCIIFTGSKLLCSFQRKGGKSNELVIPL